MTERLDDVWIGRDYPVLREATRQVDAGEKLVDFDVIAAAVGLSRDTVALAAEALERRGFVELFKAASGPIAFRDVTGTAYLMTGLHPDTDDALSGLIEMLRQAADQQPDEDERSRLRRAADGLRDVSRDVMIGVMTAYATKYGVH